MRLVALDSLRGIAAFSVVLYHALLVFPEMDELLGGRGIPVGRDLVDLLLTVPPHTLLWAGREAVLLFFVLSGFVLTLPFEREPGARPGWIAFAAKRLVRLLVPCTVVALILAVIVPLIGPTPRPELSEWFNSSWNEPVTAGMVLGHALLILPEYTLNNPMWTLHYELRISLIFPLLILLAAAGGPVLAAAALGGVLVCLVEMKFIGTGALTTLFFVPHFALGVLLARHRRAIAERLGALSAGASAALWLLCYLLLTFRWLVPAGALACDLANGLGAALLIALVLGSARIRAALETWPLPQLGAISYSLYLVHVPVLLAGLHLAPEEVPAWLVVLLTPLVSVLCATLLYRLVERPSIGLGRWVGERLEPRRSPRLAGVSR